MKTKQDNDVIEHTSMVYIENNSELSWPIKPGVVCEENCTKEPTMFDWIGCNL